MLHRVRSDARRLRSNSFEFDATGLRSKTWAENVPVASSRFSASLKSASSKREAREMPTVRSSGTGLQRVSKSIRTSRTRGEPFRFQYFRAASRLSSRKYSVARNSFLSGLEEG